MTYQEKVDLLSSYRATSLALKNAVSRMDEFRERNAGVKAVIYTSVSARVSSSRDLSDYVAKLDELEGRVWTLIHEYRQKEARIVGIIEAVEDTTERQLLTYRYLYLHTWEKVAEELGYSYRQVFRIHREAIENLDTNMALNGTIRE